MQHIKDEARKFAESLNLPKGWTTEIWIRVAIFGVNGEPFSERDFYDHYRYELETLYPNNHHIPQKISEQFTVFLRKHKLISGSDGVYRLL